MARKSVAPESASGIYEVVNTINGKRYIGSAKQLHRRWGQHLVLLRRGTHHARPLQHAWNKYGPEAFVYKHLLICAPADLVMYEQIAFNAFAPEYNVCKVAGSALGVKHSPEFSAAISARVKGIPKSPDHRQKISETLTGRPGALAGIPKTAEHRANLSAVRTGLPNPKNLGNKSRTGQKQGALEIERRSKALRENWAERKANGAATAAKQIAGLIPGSKPGRRNKTKKMSRKTQPDLFD